MSDQFDEFAALKQIVDCLRPLNDEGKIHLLKSAVTFLKLDINSVGLKDPASKIQVPIESPPLVTASFSSRKEMSPKQFLNERQPANDIERVACLAYYLTHYRDMPEFTTLDISKLNTEAAQPKFSNPSVPMDNATRKGYLVATTGRAKQLGALGEQFVQALPDREAAKLVAERVRFRRPKKRKNGSVGGLNSEGPENE